jgi:hypothetical protein
MQDLIGQVLRIRDFKKMKQPSEYISLSLSYIFCLSVTISVMVFSSGKTSSPLITTTVKNFTIVCSPEDKNLSVIIRQSLQKAIPEYEHFYGIRIQDPITILLPSSLMQIDPEVLRRLPKWSNAVFLPAEQRIILKKPLWYNTDQRLDQVFRHELSHVYFYFRFRDRKTPLWFNEGLAEYLGGTRMDISNGLALSNAMLSGNIIPLQEIDGLLTFSWSQARLGYLQSLTAVQFLEKQLHQHGIHWINFFEAVDNYGFEPALKMSAGVDLIDFEIKWYHWIDEQYKWFVIFNWENLIWVLMIVVLAGALYALRYRNRKILQQWESEEEISNQDQMTSMLEN